MIKEVQKINNNLKNSIATDSNEKFVSSNTLVEIEGGKITGVISSDLKVLKYKGIPYAAPPVGNLRWKAPQPVSPWNGIKECNNFSPNAIQDPQAPWAMFTKEFIIDTSLGYSEDCLTLNVWTKNNHNKDQKLPVIVYIHGGGFGSGSSSCEVYDGDVIAKKDIVYVSINYRVSLLGFLAHPELSAESEEGVSGNYGILDQIAALKWIKNNISKFGGDPNNVTISGQSAGSSSVHILINSPKAKGLFKNAVTMSFNNIEYDFDTMKCREEAALKIFEGKTLQDMRAMTTDEIIDLHHSYRNEPCVDGIVISSNELDILKAGTQNNVNLLTGMCEGDDSLFPPLVTGKELPFPMCFDSPTTSVSKTDFETAVRNKFGIYAEQCLEAYLVVGDEAINEFNSVNRDQNMALQYYLAKARALNSKDPTYIYYYTHTMPGEKSEIYGAFHTSEVPYFLNYFSPLRKSHWTETDYNLGDKMSSYLVNFAKTGNPNGEGLEKWDEFNGEMTFINLGNTIFNTSFDEKKAKFWKNYYGSILGI